MDSKALFTVLANTNIRQVIEYLHIHWGIGSSLKYYKKVLEFRKIVKGMPEIGRIYMKVKGKEIRQYPVTKQNMILYRIDDNRVTILKIFDVRQHPNKKLQGIK